MENKFLPLILGLLLIVQSLNAAPAASSEELTASKEELAAKALLERFKLMIITFEEFGEMFSELSEKGPKVLKEVLKDPKIQEVKTETMEKYLKEISDYVEKTEKVAKDSEKNEAFDMLDELTDITDKFDSEKHTDLSSEALLIEKSLKEHGLDDIEKSMLDHFQSFLKKFNAEVEKYFAGLNSKEVREEKSFKEWFDAMKAENDPEKKIDMFDNFLDSDEDDYGR